MISFIITIVAGLIFGILFLCFLKAVQIIGKERENGD